ncbi:unnamed protein product, partial [Ectocarpus sp. 12 AP-2014]
MMAMPGAAAGGSPAMTGLGKGLDFMMKRMTTRPVVKPRPQGYVGLDGGSFTNVGGFTEGDLKVPKIKKPKKPEKEEEPSSIGDMAGKAFVKG